MVIVEIDLDDEIRPVVVPDDRAGIAVVVRCRGRPVGFWMEEVAPGSVLSADDLDQRIGRHCGEQILGASLLGALSTEPARVSITFAVCTKDRAHGLDRTLRSLEAVRAGGYGVIVVDNASVDPYVRDVAERWEARYVREASPGLDFARNRAVQETDTDWIAFFDDDVFVDPRWLHGFADVLAAHPDADAVTGLVLPLRLDTTAQVLFERRGGFRQGMSRRRLGSVDGQDDAYPAGAGGFGTGANTAVRVDVVRELGGFDEALDAGASMPGGGDLDLYYRIVRNGGTVIYDPGCLAFHDHRERLDDLRRQFRDSWGLSFHAFLAKAYRDDPPMRAAHRRYLGRWYRAMTRDALRSLCGRSGVPASLLVAEIVGAVHGAMGAYPRAVRRAAETRVRRQ